MRKAQRADARVKPVAGDSAESSTIRVQILPAKRSVEVPFRTPVGDILPAKSGRLPVVAALVNNEPVSLATPLSTNATVAPLTIARTNGWLAFRRTMCLLLSMAGRRALRGVHLRVRFTLGRGVFAAVRDSFDAPERPMTAREAAAVEAEVRKLVAADLPIEEIPFAYGEAVELFEAEGQRDQTGILRHVNKPRVLLQHCDGFFSLHQGPMLPRTGLAAPLAFIPYEGGLVLQGPDSALPLRPAPFRPQPGLMGIRVEHARWGDIVGIHTVGDLNAAIAERRIRRVMEMSEALHEQTFASMAAAIAGRAPLPRLVLIAGPSSAGKTTSCKRLGIHLRVKGLEPVMLSTDDYFVAEEDDPIGPDGKPDYEDIRAVDVAGLRKDLATLLSGGTIRRRVFDFIAKKPAWTDETLTLGPNDVLCMEGIHGLNPILTEGIDRSRKFLIYLSAITQLGIDDSNLLSTTDNRLIRRLVRDANFRGHDARRTLSLWPSVRRGEEKWIFPFQDEADVSFNSALDYELSVLKPYAENLLAEVKPSDPEYSIARRLAGVLRNFHAIPSTDVPANSILREYIGGSAFEDD